MDYTLTKESCPVCTELLHQSSEQPVDLDFSLPDYCPDIERILKCRMSRSITSRTVSGSRFDVDGVCVIRIYYLDSKKQAVRCCEHSSPFTCSFELKSPSPDCIACVRTRTEYLNCRAVGPRRLDIHGAFTVTASVFCRGEQDYFSDIVGDDIQQKKHTEEISLLKGLSQQQFTVSEVLDIGQGKPVPESILRYELCFLSGDSRAINDKLMLRGELQLRVLYITDIENGAQDHMLFNIPVSQVIDVPGISDETVNDIRVELLGSDVSLKSEYDEGSTLISLEARLCAEVFAYENSSAEVIDDAYSTAYELQLGCQSVPVRRLVSRLNMTPSVRGELSTGDNNITRVTDIWCDSISFITSQEDGKLRIKGKLSCCILALDAEQIPFCAEKTMDFSFDSDIPDGVEKAVCAVDIIVPSVSFRITGDNTAELKADLDISGCIYSDSSVKCITSAEGLEDRRREKDGTAALTLYYADEGERLWDIAQMYCTSVEAIRMENELSDDVVQARSMILIPM